MDADILEFGKALLTTGDLDPVYIHLEQSHHDHDRKRRWLLAYSMFYHAGVAEIASGLNGYEFWDFIKTGIPKEPEGFPRSEERRHFRGHTATEAIAYMGGYRPEAIVDFWYRKHDFASVSKNVQTFPYYGPWIAFKLADMGERCLGLPIDFTNCELGIYREPRAGAALVLKGDDKAPITNEELALVVDWLCEYYNNYEFTAPPKGDRPINVQEAETILCKFKSMKHGHYFVGKDIAAVEKALQWRKQLWSIQSS